LIEITTPMSSTLEFMHKIFLITTKGERAV